MWNVYYLLKNITEHYLFYNWSFFQILALENNHFVPRITTKFSIAFQILFELILDLKSSQHHTDDVKKDIPICLTLADDVIRSFIMIFVDSSLVYFL